MGFDATQKEQLAAPLSRDNVKTRSQAGRSLSYIESWKAISEANRIFGFDGWSRETVEVKCVSERERPIGKQGEVGWGVTYTAKVRVTVAGVVREGIGAGHGIDRDLGQAHESAIKEAESDSAKRALMTFGNPFGLALYDKEQTEVENSTTPKPLPSPPPAPEKPKMTPAEWSSKAQAEITALTNLTDLESWLIYNHAAVEALNTKDKAAATLLGLAIKKRKAELETA